MSSNWIDLEDKLCERVIRARNIIAILKQHNVPITSVTVESLRMVADVLMDHQLQID